MKTYLDICNHCLCQGKLWHTADSKFLLLKPLWFLLGLTTVNLRLYRFVFTESLTDGLPASIDAAKTLGQRRGSPSLEKKKGLSATSQCLDPSEAKWKVCFSTCWVKRWKRFKMTWLYDWGNRGSIWGCMVGLISLYPVWRAVAGLYPHQLSIFFPPAANCCALQSWPVCCWITWMNAFTSSFLLAHYI